MSVSLRVGPIAYPIGRADFLGSFFDTVTVRLEGGTRGSRFPTLAALYGDGELSPDAAQLARAELANVKLESRQHPPADVVWDIDEPGPSLGCSSLPRRCRAGVALDHMLSAWETHWGSVQDRRFGVRASRLPCLAHCEPQ
ncbi:Imm70 family immunity protein [Microbacterium testaceum]|uniref:Imm70 family immunity protein n=1 Tax=Microbacterium testaceum TaxID=2033 RepID=UPI0007349285|nr:Imm70 family immunity protein [Microbacterium testaceum]